VIKMSEFKVHCNKSKELFGEEFAEVHKWLDQYAEYGFHHRQILHNKEGIEIGVQIFGELARRHLQQHIMDDWGLEKPSDIPTIRQLRIEGRTSYPTGIKRREDKND